MTTRSAAKRKETEAVSATETDTEVQYIDDPSQDDIIYPDPNFTDDGENYTDVEVEYCTDEDAAAYESGPELRLTRVRTSRTSRKDTGASSSSTHTPQTKKSPVRRSNRSREVDQGTDRSATRSRDRDTRVTANRQVGANAGSGDAAKSQSRGATAARREASPSSRAHKDAPRGEANASKSAPSAVINARSNAGDPPVHPNAPVVPQFTLTQADFAEIMRHMQPRTPEPRDERREVPESEPEMEQRRIDREPSDYRRELPNTAARKEQIYTSRSAPTIDTDVEDLVLAQEAVQKKMARMEAELRMLRREAEGRITVTQTEESEGCYDSAREQPMSLPQRRVMIQTPSPMFRGAKETYYRRAAPPQREVSRPRDVTIKP